MTPAGQRSAGAASNQYQVLGHLATGGMAELYLARSVGLAGFERYVVLKRIMAEHSRNHRFVTMFLDEARLAAQLHHPNIAQVHDIGRVGDTYFFTMEYVHGENVRDLLQRVAALKRQIPIEHTLAVIGGAAAGLHYAHDKRGIDRQPLHIVHRDVSPSNLMVAYEGAVKLVDFGIAKAATRMTETRSGAVKGKVAYMSPEQCTGGALDRRSDIFSLGIILWEMLTMSRLFKHATDFETMSAIVNGPVAPPSSKRPEIPAALDQIVLRALAKHPDDRYQSAGELLAAIEGFAERERLSMSSMALARYLRDLFGERPEPWYEIEAAGELTSMVTIETTSADLAIAMEADPFDPQSTIRSFGAGRARKAGWQPSNAYAPLAPPLPGRTVREPTPSSLPGPAARASRPPSSTSSDRRSRVSEPSHLPLPPPPNDTGPYPVAVASGLPVDPDVALDSLNEAVTLVVPAPDRGSDVGRTRVEPAEVPLIVPPEVVRATPDGDPSWHSSGGDDLGAIDLRPGRGWMVWGALGAAALGVVAYLLVGRGDHAAVPPAAAVEEAVERAVDDAPAPTPVAAPVPLPTPTPTPAVAVEPIDAGVAPAPPVADPPPSATPTPPARPTVRPPPPRPRPRVVRPSDRPKKEPSTRCGDPAGLYPPCD